MTYTKRKSWRCFHCDENFTNARHAAEHFGEDQSQTPACKLTASEGHLVVYIRKLQARLRKATEDDTDIIRAWRSKEHEHAEAVRRAEETGYGRGVADVRPLLVDVFEWQAGINELLPVEITAQFRQILGDDEVDRILGIKG